ncbi:HEAT repeat domain-containing protein [Dactylosporangium sp. NPDC050688]|uniref:HEAT repeat domain-containing protein n=1 Tax=Dactylosporangium sp. NPDC050688 TaxID=3157217 RepID=UPI0033FD29F9
MTQPPESSVAAAVERGDAGWLAAAVDGTACPPALLSRLARHADPRLRLLAVRWLGDRLAGAPDPVGDELLRLLPRDLDDVPEVALALAEVFQRCGRVLPAAAWPRWRDRPAPAVVRVAWLRAELLHLPGCGAGEPGGELLYQAVAGLRAAGAPDPSRLVEELAGRDDPVLHAAALRLCREALHAAFLAPAPARRVLVRLLDSPDAAVVAAALTGLAEPWAAVDPVVPPRLRTFLTGAAGRERSGAEGVDVLEAAVAAAARHGLRDPLLDAAADTGLPPRARQAALSALGGLLDRADIPAVIGLAARDPLLLGAPAVACLAVMHHRGLFVDAGEVAGVARLALADHSIAAEDVAMLLYTGRHRLRGTLLDAGPADPGWPRRLELLVALARQGAPDLDIGADVTGLLGRAADPGPVLAAIRALRYAPAEDAVLAALPGAPAAALSALEGVGGARAVAQLSGALGGEVPAYLRPWRHQALELCWRLTDDPGRRHALLLRLDPAAISATIAADLGHPDQRELAVLRARAAPDRPVDALVGLARHADTGTLPAVTDVLGRIVAELAAAWDTRELPPGRRHRLPADLADPDRLATATTPMPVVPQRAVDAVHELGRCLYRRRRIRPVCLLDAASEQAAGDALVAGAALDLIERPGQSPTELAVLLELLRRAPYAGTRARVHRLLRHRDPHVRKHVIALLARDGAEALSATLTGLTAAADVQTARQALTALGEAGARWAAHAVAACLEHPNMNVKKAAAEALRTAGTPATVPRLLAWLGRHDNPGLRAALTVALRAVLGTAAEATVLAAAEQAEPGRARDLLLESLDRALPARAVAALTGQGSPAGPALLRLVAAARVRLKHGTPADLTGLMVAHGVTPPAAAPPAGSDADLVALTRDGWHERTARRVAALDPADLPAPLLPALRRLLPDWLRLAATGPALRPAVLRLVLRCCGSPWTDAERAAFTRWRQVLLAGAGELAHADRDALLAVLEDLAGQVTPAVAFDVAYGLRRAPAAPAGHRSVLAVLRRCGAVLTRADVERALADAALGADPWQGEVRVLREAFGVGDEAPGEGSRRRLVALIDAWPATAPGDRPALLDRMTAVQPVDAPLWTIEETAARPAGPVRSPRDGDLDQPRSAAQRDRLLAMLDTPAPGTTQRRRAAATLLDWPEPEIRRRLLHAHLRGDPDVPPTARLAATLTPGDLTDGGGDVALVRAVRLAGQLDPAGLAPLIPALQRLREHGAPAARTAADEVLRRLPRRIRAAVLGEPLESLLTPEPVDPQLPAALLRRPSPPGAAPPPTRRDLLDRARNGDTAQIRVAIATLVETSGADAELAELLEDLLRHPDAKVRLHAHRVSRQVLERPAYLRHSEILLADPQPDIVRAAVRAVSGAAWTPAIGAVVGLLLHPDPTVRRTAEAGLARFGPAAAHALTKAAGRARPDRRGVYTTVLDGIAAAAERPG